MRGESRNRKTARKSHTSFSNRKIKSPLHSPLPTACRTVVENLEQRQLLTANGWEVSYWANNDDAGTAGVNPTYVLQDTGSNSGGTVVDVSGATVKDAINYSGGSTTVPPQLAAIGVSASWTAGPGGCSFSTRFDGILTAPETATYTFYPGADDGDQLIVDGQTLDNALNGSRGVTYESCPVSVQWAAGSTHQISYLYQNGGGGWGQDLRWSDDNTINSGSYTNGTTTFPYVPISAISVPSGPINASVQAVSGGDAVKWTPYNPSTTTVATSPVPFGGAVQTYDVYRAPATIGGTLPAASAFTMVKGAVTGDSYTDTTAAANTVYDYRVTSAGVALSPHANILNTGTALASAIDGTSANSTGTNDTLIGAGDGLTAQYFNSTDDAGAAGTHDVSAGSTQDNLTQDHAGVYSRIDTKIQTDSGNAATTTNGLPPGVPANFTAPNGTNSFSIRWDGYVLAPETGSYIFYPASDDNERFAVGNPTPLTGGANANDFGGSTITTPGNSGTETVVAEGTGVGSGSGTTDLTNDANNAVGSTLDFLNNGGRGTTYDPSQRTFATTQTSTPSGGTAVTYQNAGSTYGTVIYATAGQLIPIQMDYNEGGGGWHYSLNWSGPGFGSARVSPNYTNTYTLLTTPDLYAAQAEAPTLAATGGFQQAYVTLSLPLSGYASGGTAADSFNIYRSTASGTQGTKVGSVTIPNANANSAITTYNFTDSGADLPAGHLSDGATYYYTATAVAGGVQSAPSNQQSATTTTGVGPGAPNVAVARNAASTGGTTTVSWPAVPFATSYTVLRSTDGTTFMPLTAGTSLPGSTTSFVDATAVNTNNYYYEVTATNGGGSATSGPVYIANGDGFAATYFPSPYAGAASYTAGFHLNTTNPPASDTLSYWQDTATPTQPNAALPNAGFTGTNSYQTIDSSINFSGTGVTVKPPSTPTGYNAADAAGIGASMSAEWDFTVIPQYTGQYTFFPSTDDGVQLYVDGNLLDDQSLPAPEATRHRSLHKRHRRHRPGHRRHDPARRPGYAAGQHGRESDSEHRQ